MFDGEFTTEFDVAYPGLWDGCIGAWFPGLGPQGATLWDWSWSNSNGTLTGSTIPNAYALNNGGFSYRAGGTDYINCGSQVAALLSGSSAASLSVWVSLPATNLAAFCGVGQNLGRRFNIQRFSGQTVFYAESGGVQSSRGDTVAATGLQHWLMTFSAGTLRAWVNGVAATLGTATGTIPATLGTTGAFYIGRTQTSNAASGTWFDDIRVYNRELSVDEVRLLYSGGDGRGIAYTPASGLILAPNSGRLLSLRRRALAL